MDTTEKDKSGRRECVGHVISNKMMNTVVVGVQRTVTHPKYHKVMRRVSKLKAHDEQGQCQVGDIVRLVETRPISKHKHWRVLEIVAKRG